jgi:hypothetical protein
MTLDCQAVIDALAANIKLEKGKCRRGQTATYPSPHRKHFIVLPWSRSWLFR